MVVGDDDVDAAIDRQTHRLDRGDAAIDGDHELYVAIGEHALEHFDLQTVAIDEAMRDDEVDVRAERAEDGLQQHDGGDAVDVVVAVDQDRLAIAHRALNALARFADAVDGRWIMQVGIDHAAPDGNAAQRVIRNRDGEIAGFVSEDPGVEDHGGVMRTED